MKSQTGDDMFWLLTGPMSVSEHTLAHESLNLLLFLFEQIFAEMFSVDFNGA